MIKLPNKNIIKPENILIKKLEEDAINVLCNFENYVLK